MSFNEPPNHGTPPPPPPPGGAPPPYGSGASQTGDPGTLDLPYYGIDFPGAMRRAFQKYARFDGRASRSEFWWFYLGIALAYLVLYIPVVVGQAAESTVVLVIFGLLLGVFVLAVIVPTIAISVRRLHDAGFSGWLYLLTLVPCVSIVVIVLLVMPSKPEGAKYDRNGAVR